MPSSGGCAAGAACRSCSRPVSTHLRRSGSPHVIVNAANAAREIRRLLAGASDATCAR